MQSNWLLLVSTLLTYNDIKGALTDSEGTSSDLSNRRTSLQPYMSRYNNLYNNNENENNENKGRQVLTATLVKSFTAPFSKKSWNDIEQLTTPPFEKQELEMNVNITSVVYLYSYLVNLLMIKISHYADTRDNIENFDNYLGFDLETIDLINTAITVLAYQARIGIISIYFLLELFYFSCDIKGVFVSATQHSSVDIYDKLNEAMKKVGEEAIKYYKANDEKECKQYIINHLRIIKEIPDPSLGVSISSMKMKILIDPTTNTLINNIKNRPASLFGGITIEEYVKLYAQETQGIKVYAYHSTILGVLIMHVFGYVYEYFNLLIMLRSFEIKQEYHNTIDLFKTFMDPYMSIFIDRYFEFIGIISQDLVDAMFDLKFFLNPNDTQVSDRIIFSEIEKKVFNETATPEITLIKYYDKSCMPDSFERKIKELIDNAVDRLLETFVGDTCDYESLVDVWKKWNIMSDNYSRDVHKLLDLINESYKNATSILKIFSREFSVETNVDDKNYEPHLLSQGQ